MIKNFRQTTTLYDNTATVLVISPMVAKLLGIECALVLSQIYYWTEKCGRSISNDSGLWIYNSLEEWHRQFSFWSLSKLRRIIKSLENSKLLNSRKVNSKKWNQTKWYSINLDEYNKLFDNKDFPDKKKATRFVQNEQMLLKETKNNYTNISSYKKKEEFLKSNKTQETISRHSKLEKITLSQEQKGIAEQMVHLWNSSFECSLNPVKAFLNKKVIIQLNEILETKFDNNLENWKLYAQAVNSSKFLMGEKETRSNFKAQFLWLIKEETIDSIQNGAYGVGDRVLDSEKIDENLKVCQKEVQQIVQEKMAVKIQEKTSNETEEQEFRQYLTNREYEKDGDKYLLKKHMEYIGSQYMYGGYITPSHVFYSGNEKYRQRLFQSYLMKKYYGIDETWISSSFDRAVKDVDSRNMLLKFKNIREKLKFGTLKDKDHKDSFFRGIVEKTINIQTVCMLN